MERKGGESMSNKGIGRETITDEYLRQIAEICSDNPRKTFREISIDLGYAESYIRTLRSKHPRLVEMTDQLTRDRFKELARVGLDTTMELMVGAESETVRLNAAKEFMSRAGYDAKQVIEQTNKDITVELVNDDED